LWIMVRLRSVGRPLTKGTYPIKPATFPAVGGNEGVGEVVAFGADVFIMESNASARNFPVGAAGDDKSCAVVVERGLRVVPAEPGLGTWWGCTAVCTAVEGLHSCAMAVQLLNSAYR
jgi:hypothetical protein